VSAKRNSPERGASDGIQLPAGYTGSSLLYELLSEAVEGARDELGATELPADDRAFRSRYGEALVRFEAARASSRRRAEIARDLVSAAESRMCFRSGGSDVPLAEYWSRPAAALPVETLALGSAKRLTPRVPWDGRTYIGKDVRVLADAFAEQGYLTRAAADALRWIAEHADRAGGIDLAGQKFVVLGAGAELAATRLLLAAGASVLWVDVVEPNGLRESEPSLGGELTHVRGGADLLLQPAEIAQTVAEFASDGPVHCALYAYAGGASREWRLATAMNAIVRRLEPGAVRSVTLLVSPTSPAVVQPEDCAAASQHAAPWWQSLLERAGAFQPARVETGSAQVMRAIVPLQGVSYQAAQYVAKILTAESLAVHGTRLDARARKPVTVSANVAGISRTRSLSHPVFEAAFLGAPLFGVTTFEPATTRWLNGLLTLHDILNEDAPGSASRRYTDDAARASELFTQQFHGGIYGLPWALDPCITTAAVIGLARRPTLLWSVIRSLGS
jgi:hypothetical protein